jgi:hypothetical protein
MQEVALNVPFDSQEVIHIVTEELQARMRGLSPLQGNKEYVSFAVDFEVKIRLWRSGEAPQEGRETLAWGNVKQGDPSAADLDAVAAEEASKFESRDPNEERVARDMPLTVESGDGRGGRVRRKVKVRGA